MADHIPGSIPAGLDGTYRGYLSGEKPKLIQQENGREFVTCRIGVNMAASNVPVEDRKDLTEWVNIICFNPAHMTRLLKCEPNELISVTGGVKKRPYETRAGERRIDRTMVAEYVVSASGSMIATAPAKNDKPSELPSGDPEPESTA